MFFLWLALIIFGVSLLTGGWILFRPAWKSGLSAGQYWQSANRQWVWIITGLTPEEVTFQMICDGAAGGKQWLSRARFRKMLRDNKCELI